MPERIKPPLPTHKKQPARDLRRRGTDAEQRLWFHLRAGRPHGLKFRRQHPLPPYAVGFYCEAAKPVVELDGSQHKEDIDVRRTHYLESLGLTVLRYWDHEVLQQTEIVLESILGACGNRTLTPTPLPAGEGL
ncbi:endonuclease domain-containing protein [Dyella ginsengisoli]|uniref:Endonuclease domain-containing protein n=1 Tax=Dyella ginsengisoli TaxID=363848 RepID=A0ABW8JWY6_9GAMM